MQLITSQFAGNLIEAEYSYGLSEFQDSIDWSRENLTETEIVYLSEQINLMVLYGESLIKQSKQLFDNYGFIVDAKRIYFFVLDVRGRIKGGINSLIDEFSSSRIERKLSKVFRLFSMNLKAIVDVEIVKIQRAVNREEDALECWEIYKLLMFELGFDAINELQLLSLSTAVNLVMQQESMKRDVSSKINQLIAALSESHSTLFEARSRINTYVSFCPISFALKGAKKRTFFLDRRQPADDARSNRFLVPANCHFTSTSDGKCTARNNENHSRGKVKFCRPQSGNR